MTRYWNDTELMSKIASKMGAMELSPARPKPSKKLPPVTALHKAKELWLVMRPAANLYQQDSKS